MKLFDLCRDPLSRVVVSPERIEKVQMWLDSELIEHEFMTMIVVEPQTYELALFRFQNEDDLSEFENAWGDQ